MRKGGAHKKTYSRKEEKSLSITLKQFDGAHVTPKDDAVLYSHLEPRNGILTGCEVSFLGGNQIQIGAGYGIVHGRLFLIEAETINVTLSSSGTVAGRLVVGIDISNFDIPISFVQQTGSTLPELIQENLNSGGSVFELPLATYNVEATQLSNFKDVRPTIAPESDNVEYTKSGSINEVLNDGYEYTFNTVTSLVLKGGNGRAHGWIYFGSSTPSIDVTFDSVLGDDINSAIAGERWEFDVENNCAFFANWGVIG